MNLLNVLIIISSLSFMGYGIAYFTSTKMKSEFKRFGIEKAGAPTAVLEILGSLGLLVGLKFHFILLLSAGGLAILMFLGIAIRIKVRDALWVTLPAFVFMILNAYIFIVSMQNYNHRSKLHKVLSVEKFKKERFTSADLRGMQSAFYMA